MVPKTDISTDDIVSLAPGEIRNTKISSLTLSMKCFFSLLNSLQVDLDLEIQIESNYYPKEILQSASTKHRSKIS